MRQRRFPTFPERQLVLECNNLWTLRWWNLSKAAPSLGSRQYRLYFANCSVYSRDNKQRGQRTEPGCRPRLASAAKTSTKNNRLLECTRVLCTYLTYVESHCGESLTSYHASRAAATSPYYTNETQYYYFVGIKLIARFVTTAVSILLAVYGLVWISSQSYSCALWLAGSNCDCTKSLGVIE